MQLAEAIQASKHNPRINQMQCLAAILVIFSHAFPLSGSPSEPISLITNGQWTLGELAVAILFIFSGFLVTQSFARQPRLLPYLKKRFLRIYPALWACYALMILVLGPVLTNLPVNEYFQSPNTWRYFWQSQSLFPDQMNLPGVFTANAYGDAVNGSLWTIIYQVCFYVFLGVAGILGLLKRRWPVLAAWFMVLLLFETKAWLLIGAYGVKYDVFLTNATLLASYFCVGMLAALYAEHIPLNHRFALISLVSSLVCFVLGQYVLMMSVFGWYWVLYLAYHPRFRTPSFGIFENLSYGLYIYAFPVQQTIAHLFGGAMNPFLNFVLAFPITLLFAMLSWKLIEKPLQRFK